MTGKLGVVKLNSIHFIPVYLESAWAMSEMSTKRFNFGYFNEDRYVDILVEGLLRW